jgi:hypothetical protein
VDDEPTPAFFQVVELGAARPCAPKRQSVDDRITKDAQSAAHIVNGGDDPQDVQADDDDEADDRQPI